MSHQTVAYSNGVITLTKRDGSQQAMTFDGASQTSLSNVPYNASDYGIADGGTRWVVEEADMETNHISQLSMETIIWSLLLENTVIQGTPGELTVRLPSNLVPINKKFSTVFRAVFQGGAEACIAEIEKRGTSLGLYRIGGAAWPAGNASIAGQIMFQVEPGPY